LERRLPSEGQTIIEDNSWSTSITIAASEKGGRDEGTQNLLLNVFQISSFGQRETESY